MIPRTYANTYIMFGFVITAITLMFVGRMAITGIANTPRRSQKIYPFSPQAISCCHFQFEKCAKGLAATNTHQHHTLLERPNIMLCCFSTPWTDAKSAYSEQTYTNEISGYPGHRRNFVKTAGNALAEAQSPVTISYPISAKQPAYDSNKPEDELISGMFNDEKLK